ncbi:MAG TPA: hypothetical protein VF943_12265 [Burkholderiales bacterium]
MDQSRDNLDTKAQTPVAEPQSPREPDYGDVPLGVECAWPSEDRR